MSKKILAVLLCLSLLFALFTVSVSANGDMDNDISYDQLEKEEDVQLVSITMKTLPKVAYVEGDAFDVTGGVVKLIYSDDFTEDISLSEGMVTGFDSATVGEQWVTVTYEGRTTSFPVTVTAQPVLDTIWLDLPTKVSYYVGETLDLSGLVVYAAFDGAPGVVVTDYEVGAVDMSTVGTKTVFIYYQNKTTSFDVTVSVKPADLTGIAITTKPTKVSYVAGDKLNTAGMVVTASYSDNTTKPVTDYTVAADLSAAGTKTVTVTYQGKTATFSVTVVAKAVTAIAVTKKPTKVSYVQGDALNTAGMQLTLTYNNGAKQVVSSGFKASANLNTAGSAVKVTVTYGGKTAAYTVKVAALGTPKAKASIATKGIKVSWGKISGADKYVLQRRQGSGKWSTVKTTTSTSYTDTKASYGKSYTYRVKAVNGSVEKTSKATASLRRLKAPSSIKLSKASKGFKVTWSKVSGAKNYELYRKTGSGKWTKVKTLTKTTYTDKTAKKGKYYTYRVRATYGDSDGAYKTSKKTKR